MQINDAIRLRRSIRGFKLNPVPKRILEDILGKCLWAPSSRNQQSWEFAILGGEVMEQIKILLDAKLRAKEKEIPDLPAYELPENYLRRANALRDGVDRHQFPPGTEKLEEKRAAYWLKGGCFYDAPNAIILYTEKSLGPKAIFDGGIMAQTIALAALEHGLGTCITIRPVNWPEILREKLGIPSSKLILVAIAIGYPDNEDKVNSYPRQRDPLSSFVHWYGF
jgi:nitroreductase